MSEQQQRKWQRQAYDIWSVGIDGVIQPDYTVVVTPGGGKTRFAGDCAKFALEQEIVHQLIVVVPSRNIQRGFTKALANHHGIVLDRLSNRNLQIVARHAGARNPFGSDARGRKIVGCVATYQQVASHPQVFRQLMQTPTLVVMDEIHHASEKQPWGAALGTAFENARHRLMMSGTPWRSNADKLPFLKYAPDENDSGVPCWRVVPDYSYSYVDALLEGIVRPIAFPTLDGECEWFSNAGKEMTANLKDEIDPKFVSERLRTWLRSTESMRAMIRTAHEKLTFLRSEGGHRDAGGLIIAIDQDHARQIVELVREVTNTEPALAISDDTDQALLNIEHFQASSRPWLVAVRMVSEGTDIPRLRVLAYATTVKTELSFKQACGRVVRMIVGVDFDQQAYVYIPADVELIRFAEQFRHDVAAYARLHRPDRAESGAGVGVGATSIFAPISASATEGLVLEDGFRFEPTWLAKVREHIRVSNLTTSVSEIQIAKLLESIDRARTEQADGQPEQESWLPEPRKKKDVRIGPNDTPEEQREKLRRLITTLVGTCARRFGMSHEDVRRDLARRFGLIDFLPIGDLTRQADLLKLWLIGGEYGGGI